MGDRPVRGPLSGVRRRVLAHAGAAVGLLGLGGAVAVSATALHPHWWGLALGIGATAAVTWALPDRWWGRTPFALGWTATVILVTAGRTEGDYALASNTPGHLVLATAVIVLVVGMVSLRPRHGGMSADSGGSSGSS